MNKKILIFCSPFDGHTTILKEFINQYQASFELQLVITGWKNIEPSIEGVSIPVIKLGASKLEETDPAIWTFPRVNELIEECIKITKNFNPDLIIYDFFSLEGYFVGQLLGIPHWSSIPAMIGPYDKQEYLRDKLSEDINVKSMQKIYKLTGINPLYKSLEMISDGIHIPGIRNIVWSYRAVIPVGWNRNRNANNYNFVGNIRARKIEAHHDGQTIFFSLGTVVMNNLWNQQKEIQPQLEKFISILADLWEDKSWKVIFVTQGRKILKSYPNNWQVEDTVDQIKYLSISDVFVTHGGANSFNEALVQRVPMVVIPFFGDQQLVGHQVENLGLGINLIPNQSIDTHKTHEFLSQSLAADLNLAVEYII